MSHLPLNRNRTFVQTKLGHDICRIAVISLADRAPQTGGSCQVPIGRTAGSAGAHRGEQQAHSIYLQVSGAAGGHAGVVKMVEDSGVAL
jgi:hypothetical protein